MSDFLEENKKIVLIILALVFVVSIFILVKSIFSYSPPKGGKTITRPAEETGFENLRY